MHVTDSVTPVASADGNEGELGSDEGALDRDLDLLGELDTKTDVAVLVTNNNDGLEAGALTGLGLLLDGDDLHDFVGEGSLGLLNEHVDYGGLLDGNGVGVDLLQGGDVSVLDETTELGLGGPVILAAARATTAATTTTVAATAATTATIATATESTTATAAFLSGCLCGCLSFHLF